MITAEQFEKATGNKPVDDDLERVNCVFAGEATHLFCGWCKICNNPVFQCICNFKEAL